jgi:hypothetical protein
MIDDVHEHYRGVRIIAHQHGGLWQARAEGIGALSGFHWKPHEAIAEIRRYLDDVEQDRLTVARNGGR